MAEDANYLRCGHGWKRGAWPASRDRCPHCTGTGEAPEMQMQLPRAIARMVVENGGPINGMRIRHFAATGEELPLGASTRPRAAKPNTTHRLSEHEREYGGCTA